MRVVGRGNANIVIDYGDPDWLYRCCVRFKDSSKRNNEYSVENMQYIQTSVKTLLKGLLCPMVLKEVPLGSVESVLRKYLGNLDDDKVVVFQVPNLKPSYLGNIAYTDHFTQIYVSDDSSHVLLELKPKWLYSPFAYCRNCTHNKLKGRELRYCYSRLSQDPHHLEELLAGAGGLPSQFRKDLASYLERSDNVLAVLYDAQKELRHEELSRASSVGDVSSVMSLAMTLRDVSCFIEWRSDAEELRVNVVDVDFKPAEKFSHWRDTQLKLDDYHAKCYH